MSLFGDFIPSRYLAPHTLKKRSGTDSLAERIPNVDLDHQKMGFLWRR